MIFEYGAKPINRLAARGLTSNKNDPLQTISPLPYYKFKMLAKSKSYRNRTPGMTPSQRMDILAIELGARDFAQYRTAMIMFGEWNEKHGKHKDSNA